MSKNKSATLTLRIDLDIKESLRTAAEQEHRSIANMIEVMILDYCSLNDIKFETKKPLLSKQNDLVGP